MRHVPRYLFFILFVKPMVLLVLGLNVRHRERLTVEGPAILVANHNSHLDAWVMMNLFPLRMLHRLRPVAASDYFMKGKFSSWLATRVVGIVPFHRLRHGAHDDPLAGCGEAIDRGDVLLFFPEGTRGEPEERLAFKTGIAHLAKRYEDIPVLPVFLYGCGKALPRKTAILVPFVCDVFVGEPVRWAGDRGSFMEALEHRMAELAGEHHLGTWE